jgi:hypothetical protein
MSYGSSAQRSDKSFSVEAAAGGLGFSEFIEFIASIALFGMRTENYHILFPSPYAKVLSILTVWGLADLNKLEEVRAISLKRIF